MKWIIQMQCHHHRSYLDLIKALVLVIQIGVGRPILPILFAFWQCWIGTDYPIITITTNHRKFQIYLHRQIILMEIYVVIIWRETKTRWYQISSVTITTIIPKWVINDKWNDIWISYSLLFSFSLSLPLYLTHIFSHYTHSLPSALPPNSSFHWSIKFSGRI